MGNRIIVVDENGNEVKSTIGEKAKKARDVVIGKTAEAIEWASENPKEAIGSIIAAGAAFAGLKKILPTKTATQKERDRIDHTYYDPQTGLHWQLTRRLTNAERGRIAAAKRDGTPVENVLSRMGVLAR